MEKICQWRAQSLSTPLVALHPGQMHVYAMRCDAGHHALAYESYLSADENKRAKALLQADDRRRFILGRGVLRDLVGRYLGIAPAMVAFNYGEMGKPYVDMSAHGAGLSTPSLHFNLSHSGVWLLYGFCLGMECGVDIEYINHKNNYLRIAKRFFHGAEFDRLQALDPVQRATAFYKLWVLKEAYAKAIGQPLLGVLGMALATTDTNDQKKNDNIHPRSYFAENIDVFSGYEAAWCWPQACRADVRAYVLGVG